MRLRLYTHPHTRECQSDITNRNSHLHSLPATVRVHSCGSFLIMTHLFNGTKGWELMSMVREKRVMSSAPSYVSGSML